MFFLTTESPPWLSYRFLRPEKSTLNQLVKGLIHVASVSCRCLQIAQSILHGVILNGARFDFSHFRQIWFVTYQHHSDVSICVILELSQPFLYIFKGFRFSNVEGDDRPNCSTIIGVGDCSKSFLACSIPYLILDTFAIYVGSLGCELHSDRGLWVHIEGVIDEAREEVRLADARVADHNYFEEVIKLFLTRHE